MDGKQFQRRVRSIVLLLCVILFAFAWVLYDLQYVHGAEYLEQSQRRIARTETVEAARGEILDRYGRVLVTNQESYNVSLDTSFMNGEENAILTQLLAISREEGVAWTDTLPISDTAPFVFTFDTASSGAVSNLQRLAEDRDWSGLLPTAEEVDAIRETAQAGPSAQALMEELRAYYEIDPALSDAEARDLIGVRYELTLRSREITYTAYVFAQDVQMPFIVKVTEAGLAGVNIDTTSTRVYNTPYAAHVLGRVTGIYSGEEDYYQDLGYSLDAKVGRGGVEQAFESYLHGTPGRRSIETDDQGKVVSGDVVLTLDIKLQEVVERALANGIEGLASEDTRGGAAVVVDMTGGVLASASYPTYDLATYGQNYNTLADDPLSPLLNRATQGAYPPGSTFKMVTALGALEEGIITPTSIYRCTGRYTFYPNPSDQPMCWIYRQNLGIHGNQNVTQAIMNSCNIFFYDAGRRLGIDKLREYAAAFGLGEPTGIEIAESTGRMAGPETSAALGQEWHEGNIMSISIGQENSQFTPLQLANYVATLANGGTHYAAHLLKEVKSSDYSEVTYQYEPQVLNELDLDPENLSAVTEGMLLMTTEGSARSYFANLDIPVAAKSGSAQVSSETESNSLFVCFAPYDDPEIALAIVVERGGSGSLLSSIAVEILEYYFSSGGGMETVTQENTLLR